MGSLLARKPGKDRHSHQQEQTGLALADGGAADADIAVGGPAEDPVEPVVELLQRAGSLLLRLEQQGAEGRERERALKAEKMTETAMVTANCW